LRTRAAAAALAGLVGIAALAACGKPAGTGTGTPDGQATAEQGLGDSGTGNNGNTGGNPSGGATRTASPRPSTSRTPSLLPGPTIEYFRVKQARMCPSLSAPNPLSKELILEWKVTGGATGVKLLLNGGTFYGNAPTTDTPTVAFACSNQPGKTATHVYELKTIGGGAERTAKLTLSAQTPP